MRPRQDFTDVGLSEARVRRASLSVPICIAIGFWDDRRRLRPNDVVSAVAFRRGEHDRQPRNHACKDSSLTKAFNPIRRIEEKKPSPNGVSDYRTKISISNLDRSREPHSIGV